MPPQKRSLYRRPAAARPSRRKNTSLRVPKKARGGPSSGFVADVVSAASKSKPTDNWPSTSATQRQANRKAYEDQRKKGNAPLLVPKHYLNKPTPGLTPPPAKAFGRVGSMKYDIYQWDPKNRILPTYQPAKNTVIVHGRPVQALGCCAHTG